MRVVADTHVHVYPCYDLPDALVSLVDHLGKLDGDAVKTAFLAERSDCRYFAGIREGLVTIPDEGPRLRSANEENAVVLSDGDERQLYLFAGRQVVTAERIEILALTVDVAPTDGLPAREVVEAILDEGGIPVLSWAPGKWFFSRKQVVLDLISRFRPDQILLGDTTLRPTVWPEPFVMRRAARREFNIIGGSDPLPFPGEERYMGRYATLLNGPFEPDRPVSSIREILRRPDAACIRVGERCGPLQVLARLRRNAAASQTNKG